MLSTLMGACGQSGTADTIDGAVEAGGGGLDVAPTGDATAPDATAPDGAPADASGLADAPERDGATADQPAPHDADPPTRDVAADADAGAIATDRPAVDAADSGAPADVADASAMDVGPGDVPGADVTPADRAPVDAPASDAGCPGAAPSVAVGAPTSGEVIETCSASGQPVYYDFTATVASPVAVRSVVVRWITPDGLAAPPSATLSAAPYSFRREVGGPSASEPALSVFGIRGTWQVEFTALDACGRSTVTSRPFSLIYTTRRCPNP